MAYLSVAQSDHGSPRHDPFSKGPDSPTYQITDDPLNQSIDARLRQGISTSTASCSRQDVGLGVETRIISREGKYSYEVVEDDDYDDVPPPPPLHRQRPSTGSNPASITDASAHSDQVPARTASVSRSLPLKHPTPDLQSLQGAYLKNVERLEESAERLSFTSSLGDKIQKMKQEQRNAERQPQSRFVEHLDTSPRGQFSAIAITNDIIGVNQVARSGGYSPAGYVASPTGSMRSAIWQHNPDRKPSKTSPVNIPLEESELEDVASVEDEQTDLQGENAEPEPEPQFGEVQVAIAHPESQRANTDRPGTSASDDTCRQANTLFNDFDGVHYSASLRSSIDRQSLRRISIDRPPLARDSKAFREPQPGEQMIYYPAPVPVMLNLPQRISRANFGEQERRRLQGLSAIPSEMRKAAPWLEKDESSNVRDKRMSNLPPQLRAQAFFEQPSISASLQLKDGSAVATLDSLLDAAAFAPVNAFVDHPVVGQLGQEVYGPESSPKKSSKKKSSEAKRRRGSFGDRLKARRSSTALSISRMSRITSRESKALENIEALSGDDLDQAAAATIAPGEDEMTGSDEEKQQKADGSGLDQAARDGDGDDEGEEEEGSVHPGFNSAPTTLLAELQMRKAQQKLRNRTAADAFPNGMHSTLLELDAVTQLQQKSRKQKHVTLAWEDQEAANRQNFDDEDVPLAVLFPEKDRPEQYNQNRPIGLLEKREIEDNEPLSHRRARLRGEPIQQPQLETTTMPNDTTAEHLHPYKLEVPGLVTTELPEEEEETLAQRAKRMKDQKEKSTGGDFVAEISSQLGLTPAGSDITPSKTPDIEETLGQRKKRLQEEATRKVSGGSADAGFASQGKPRYTMADLLQAHPSGVTQQMSYQPRMTAYNHMGTNFANRSYMPGAHPAPPVGFQQSYGMMAPQVQMYQQPMQHAQSNPLLPHMSMGRGVAPGVVGYQNPYGNGMPQYGVVPMLDQPLDPRQRAVIDQWRSGIF